MTDFKEKIDKIKSPISSNAKEKGKYRISNQWLLYSSEIARRILAILEDREDLNQSRLAEVLEVSPQQISKIVKGQENMTLETIYNLSKALNVELITFPPYKWSLMELGGSVTFSKSENIKVSPDTISSIEDGLSKGDFKKAANPTMYVAHKTDATTANTHYTSITKSAS